MSEFQYYDFRAIDRPLDREAQAALRRISSRGAITAHSFVNTYEWGDFKGDPRRLTETWFDLFVYWANWGTRTLILRAPRRYLDLQTINPYAVDDIVESWTTGDVALVRFNRDNEGPRESYLKENQDFAGPFGALRAEMLGGDKRVFYLGWLLGVVDGAVDDDTPEPPRPPGLASLSAPLKAFVDFFELDPDLLDAAAEGDTGVGPSMSAPSDAELGAFLDSLPEAEKTTLLRRAVLENDPHVRLDLRRLWALAAHPASPTSATADPPRRTVRDLRARADALATERKRRKAAQAAAQRARRDEQARREQAERLDKLAPRAEMAWREVEALMAEKLDKPYANAVDILKDLAALADRDGTRVAFDRRLREFRERHRRKRTALVRLDKAGLGGGPPDGIKT